MTSLDDMLSAAMRGEDRDDDDDAPPQPLPEAVIDELRMKFANYGMARFRPGDLVTPAKNSDMKGAGQPHIVLEVRYLPEPDFVNTSGAGSNTYGARFDMRVAARVRSGEIAAHWVESYQMEPYTGEGA